MENYTNNNGNLINQNSYPNTNDQQYRCNYLPPQRRNVPKCTYCGYEGPWKKRTDIENN